MLGRFFCFELVFLLYICKFIGGGVGLNFGGLGEFGGFSFLLLFILFCIRVEFKVMGGGRGLNCGGLGELGLFVVLLELLVMEFVCNVSGGGIGLKVGGFGEGKLLLLKLYILFLFLLLN